MTKLFLGKSDDDDLRKIGPCLGYRELWYNVHIARFSHVKTDSRDQSIIVSDIRERPISALLLGHIAFIYEEIERYWNLKHQNCS